MSPRGPTAALLCLLCTAVCVSPGQHDNDDTPAATASSAESAACARGRFALFRCIYRRRKDYAGKIKRYNQRGVGGRLYGGSRARRHAVGAGGHDSMPLIGHDHLIRCACSGGSSANCTDAAAGCRTTRGVPLRCAKVLPDCHGGHGKGGHVAMNGTGGADKRWFYLMQHVPLPVLNVAVDTAVPADECGALLCSDEGGVVAGDAVHCDSSRDGDAFFIQ